MIPKTERENRSSSDVIRKMLEPLRSHRFTGFPGQALFKILLSVTPNSASDLMGLQAPLLSAIALQPEVADFLQSIDSRDDLEIIEKCQGLIFLEGRGGNIVHLILRRLINTDLAMEQVLTSLRSAYLRLAVRQPASVAPEHLRTMLTIALQSFNNEYVFYTTREEEEICREILAGIAAANSNPSTLASRVIAYAMYHPIAQLSLSKDQIVALTKQDGDVQELIDRQIRDDALERDLAANIASFGRIENEVSIKVRQQYEESPYPRWTEFASRRPRQFADYIKKQFPFLDDDLPLGNVNCLVAGCGTGNHALEVASRFPDAAVTAIDLSRRSLAYGMRQAVRYGIANIEFFHGDLLEIEALKREFHFIESVGVLHHMEDPFKGFKALTEVLRSGGFMRIAVYRRSFRDRIKPAQEFVRARIKSHAVADLRTVRHELSRQASIDMEIYGKLADFYSISEFRDLFCHTQETSFTPAEIKELLRKLNLEFLGMDYSECRPIETAFRASYPDRSRVYDLDVYEEFESARADQMPSLLEFWVRKRR